MPDSLEEEGVDDGSLPLCELIFMKKAPLPLLSLLGIGAMEIMYNKIF